MAELREAQRELASAPPTGALPPESAARIGEAAGRAAAALEPVSHAEEIQRRTDALNTAWEQQNALLGNLDKQLRELRQERRLAPPTEFGRLDNRIRSLSADAKKLQDEKDKLTKRIKEENLTIDQIDDQLKAIKKEQGEIEGIVKRLSWSKVVVIPLVLSAVALGLGATTIGFAGLAEVHELVILLVAAGFLLAGFVHLLMSLRMIEQTAIRPEMRIEG